MTRKWGLVRLTVPMNGRIDGQFVGHEYLNVISFIHFNQGAGLLTIDEVDIATDTVWSNVSGWHIGQDLRGHDA